jgi:lysylphosphatidylglycerol synthetase-like protein (DUF2156 family)
LPPLTEPGSQTAKVREGFTRLFTGVFYLSVFSFGIGSVFKERLRLRPREAFILGFVFYLLVTATAVAGDMFLKAHIQSLTSAWLLALLALVLGWVVAVQQCVRRARKARQRAADK